MNLERLFASLDHYRVVLKPDRDQSEWWAGAPSVAVAQDGTFYLAARLREGDSLCGRRGDEIRILKSADGVNYTPVQSISRDEVGID
jgi:hypothetical protein